MRERWLLAISELGRHGAAEDAAHAFAEHMGCSVDDGRALVRRAWQTLGISDATTQPANCWSPPSWAATLDLGRWLIS